MVGASKILTVSYGTFSCTLEGFDDSFGTMKAIAEYFRDLAAQDRYFGAEPPTPDTELLQRIAEREIRKRVEARVGEDGIVLRPAALTSGGMAPVFADQAPQTSAASPHAEAGERGPDDTDSVAAKLARIRAVVENARAAAPAEPMILDPCQAPAVDPPPPDPAPLGEGHPDPKSPDPAAEAPDGPPARPAAEPRAGIGEETVARPGAAAGTWAPEAPREGPVAAEDAAATGAGAAAMDDDLSAPAARVADDVAMTETSTAEVAKAETPTAPAAKDPTERVLAVLRTSAADENSPQADPAQVQAPAAPRARARVLKLRRADLAAHWPGAVPRAKPAAEEARLPDALEAELQAELAALRAAFGQPDTAGTDRKVEADATAGIEADEPSATVDAWTETAAVAVHEADEAEHAEHEDARATEAEDDFHADATDDEPADAAHAPDLAGTGDEGEAAAPAPLQLRAADRLPMPEPERVETALQRLWDETNTKLDGAEQRRRRASIAHLKAAVAATFADRKSGHEGRPGAEDETARRPYRQVLAKVVRGTRDKPSTARPTEGSRLAPLILVSEQRIDTDRLDPRNAHDAIRPRRVTADAENEDAEADTGNRLAADSAFSAFVEERGATGIADVLEAAAAYVQNVQGKDRFTRPDVLRLTMEHLGADTSREEVLRAFGSLLRIGAFKKVRRGDFVLTRIETGGDGQQDERRHA